jgi:cellulose synthase/poly-beta-1,6-N-acetylglucosamine synthase-like glycosyltransferase
VSIFFETILTAGSILVLLPAAVLLTETVAALLPARRDRGRAVNPDVEAAFAPRIAVLVPSHNEAGQIAATVHSLRSELPAAARLVVVADNCSDDTAALAAGAGAEVFERQDRERAGKGFAISFGLDCLASDPPDVVILVDADCRISKGGLTTLGCAAFRAGRPVQAEYLLGATENPTPLAALSALAILLRNRVRPRGLRRLGLPCALTGSGMAFPWEVLRAAPASGSNLVEDLVTGIELALRGYPAEFCAEVQIESTLPETDRAGIGQRRRWEHGQLQTLVAFVPRLLAAGVRRREAALIGLGLDLTVPPVTLLVMVEGAWFGVTFLAAAAKLTSFVPSLLAAASLASVGLAVAAAWVGFGRRTLPLRQVLFVPAYLLWKLPVYLALALRRGQKTWERTARKGELRTPQALE